MGIRDRLTKEEYEHVTVRQTIEARKAGYLMTDGSLAFIFYSLYSRKSARGKAQTRGWYVEPPHGHNEMIVGRGEGVLVDKSRVQ